MAKKSKRPVARKTSKKSVRRSAKKAAVKSAAAKKSAPSDGVKREGRRHVNFGLQGMTAIMKSIREAGLETELNEAMKGENNFVKIPRKSLVKMKEFIDSKPELSGLATEMDACNCPPDDPFCIWI